MSTALQKRNQAKISTAVARKYSPLQIAAQFSVFNGNCQGPLTFFCCREERCGIRNQMVHWATCCPAEMECLRGTAARHETAVMRLRLMMLCFAVRSSISLVMFRRHDRRINVYYLLKCKTDKVFARAVCISILRFCSCITPVIQGIQNFLAKRWA